jgi:hypothetical protein
MTGYRRCSDCGGAFYPRRGFHRLCTQCWEKQTEPAPRQQTPAVLDALTIRRAAALTHPDRHPLERRGQAKEVTQALLRALEEVRR